MSTERVLFVDHTGQIGGAELILIDVVAHRPKSSVFRRAGSPSRALADRGVRLLISKWGKGLAQFRRDSSWRSALPLLGRLAAITLEIARVSRNPHDLVYANSQKAFAPAAFAHLLVRRPLIWHLHDIISPEHFGAVQRRLQVLLANACAGKVAPFPLTAAAAAAFVRAGGRQNLIEVVANGLSLQPEPGSQSELRRSLGCRLAPSSVSSAVSRRGRASTS